MFSRAVRVRTASQTFRSLVPTLSGIGGYRYKRLKARKQESRQSKKQCKHSQPQSLQDRCADLPLCASACFRRRALVVWVMAEKAARCLHQEILVQKASQGATDEPQLKTAGTQKVFPLSPLRTPLTPSQKNKECNLSLGGTGGTLFTQHYSCPAVLRCYIGFCGRLSGYRFVCHKWLPQSRSPARAALNRQGGNIRVAAILRITPLLQISYLSQNLQQVYYESTKE